jgi:hypothetical protein
MKKTEHRNLPPQEESAEIELTAEELLKLSRPQHAATPSPAPKIWHSSLVLASVGSVLLLATIVTLRSGASEAISPPELPAVPVQDEAQDAFEVRPDMQDAKPVRIRNPFDRSEVFEFPSGTSEQQAHDAVADMLLKRAMDRQAEYDSRHTRKRRRI